MTTLHAGWLNLGRTSEASAQPKRSRDLRKQRPHRRPRVDLERRSVDASPSYRFPIEQAAVAALVAGPMVLLGWTALMWHLAGPTAALLLTGPLFLAGAPVVYVLRRLYARTNIRKGCLDQLERRPKNDYSSRQLGPYPYGYVKTARHRDRNGVIEIRQAGGKTIQPTVTIAQYALCTFAKYFRSRDPDLRKDFLRHADALLGSQQIGGRWDGCWVQNHYQEYYAPHEPEYISSMAQSQAISVLLRAYQLTDDRTYLECAERAMKPFEKTVGQGGVRTDYPDGKIFFEEYGLRPFYSHTLNGFIYTLFGLEEMARVCDHERARYWFERGMETLARPGVLEVYDLGYISAYDQLNRKLPAIDYHRTHISQLESLYDITGRAIFHRTAMRWLDYTKNPLTRFRLTVHLLANKMLTGVSAVRRKTEADPVRVSAGAEICRSESPSSQTSSVPRAA